MEKHTPVSRTPHAICVSFSLLVILHSACVQGASQFTIKGKFLLGYELRASFETDWIGCLLSCQNDNDCVSYNYNIKKNSCQFNSHGLEHGCMAEDVLLTGNAFVFHQLKPVKNGRIASRRKPNKCSCNCGVDADQCTSKTVPGFGDTPELAADSCKEILLQRRDAKNGPYYLKTFPNTSYTYCHMNTLPGCGGGGWTLVMKMDGKKQNFSYNSSKWSAMTPYLPSNGQNLSEAETLMATYWSTRFNRLCLGMKYDGDTNWIVVNHTAYTLFSVMSSPTYETQIDVSEWKSLLPNSSLQTNCTKQGFNIYHGESASARIGITGFSCLGGTTTSRSRIGFGTGGKFYGMDGTNTCGNEAKGDNLDNGGRSIKAFGYIFIQ